MGRKTSVSSSCDIKDLEWLEKNKISPTEVFNEGLKKFKKKYDK